MKKGVAAIKLRRQALPNLQMLLKIWHPKIKILVDDQEMALMAAGSEMSFNVQPGLHSIEAKYGMFSSETIELQMTTGGSKSLECGYVYRKPWEIICLSGVLLVEWFLNTWKVRSVPVLRALLGSVILLCLYIILRPFGKGQTIYLTMI